MPTLKDENAPNKNLLEKTAQIVYFSALNSLILTRQNKLEKLYCENSMVKIKPPIAPKDIDWFVSYRKNHIVEPFRYETGLILLMSLIPVLGWMLLILRMHEMKQTKQFQEIENNFKEGLVTIASGNSANQPK